MSFNKRESRETFVKSLRSNTPARIGIGSAGGRYRTESQLKFREDLAISKDAVHREVDDSILAKLKLPRLQSTAQSRKDYLMNSKLGRFLDRDSKEILNRTATKNSDIQILVSDGLSSEAFERNVPEMLPLLESRLQDAGLVLGTSFFIRWARVGILDDVGEITLPKAGIVLLGERPGLGISDSLSAYFGYQPCAIRVESDRNVLSNIHRQGIPPTEAALMLADALIKIVKIKQSGMTTHFDFT